MKLNLSVIITTFNSKKTIVNCLNSLAASCAHAGYDSGLEVIIVDDGSTDGSMEIIRYFNSIFANYKIIEKKKNTGNADTRNVGLDVASGEYITFIDSDDEVTVDYLTEINKNLSEKKTDMLIFGYNQVEDENIVQEKIKIEEIHDKNLVLKKYFHIEDGDAIGSYTWNKVFKKSLLSKNKIRFLSGKKFEDVPFCFNCILCASSVKCINKCLYNYIYRSDSTVHNVTEELILDRLWSLKEIKNMMIRSHMEELYPDYYQYCLSAYFYLYKQVNQ